VDSNIDRSIDFDKEKGGKKKKKEKEERQLRHL
jgi:hypothetical protein